MEEKMKDMSQNNTNEKRPFKMEGDEKGLPPKWLVQPQQHQALQVFDRICDAGRFDEDEAWFFFQQQLIS
nr:hypothetical protein [Tanacetum cinerariifolium]